MTEQQAPTADQARADAYRQAPRGQSFSVAPNEAVPRWRATLGIVLAFLIFAYLAFFAPVPQGLGAQGRATLAVVAWAAIIWFTEALPVGVSGLMLPALLVLSHAEPHFAKAASGFTAPVTFLCLAAFLFSSIMQLAGLDRRIALVLLDKLKARTANGVVWAMFLVNFLLALVVPAANARSATLLPVVNGITRLFGDTEKERNAKKAIVIQSLVYGAMISGMCILTAHLPNMVVSGLLQKQLGIQISYFDWLRLQWPYLGMFVVTQLWVQYFFKSRAVPLPGGLTAIRAARDALPPSGREGWIVLLVLGAVAVLWATESLHHLSSELVGLLGLAVLFAPGVLRFSWIDVQQRTMWGTLLLLGGALSLSAAISGSGLAQWAADKIYWLASHHVWWLTLAIVMLGTHVMRIGMLSNVAAVTIIAPIALALAPRLGLHPAAFTMLISDTDSFAYLLPTQITAGVIAYGSGTFSTADYAKVGVVSVLIGVAYGIFVMAPWYAFQGMPIWDATAPAWPFAH